jgi:hypothetical protein
MPMTNLKTDGDVGPRSDSKWHNRMFCVRRKVHIQQREHGENIPELTRLAWKRWTH